MIRHSRYGMLYSVAGTPNQGAQEPADEGNKKAPASGEVGSCLTDATR